MNISDEIYYEKYLKYKKKYLEMKKQLGGTLKNVKNILIMGTGPIGLISALALLTKYPARFNRDKINCLHANNIFLLGKDNPWRPQIFFLQNSFRDYASADFLRDIDLEFYQKLEQIGCYSGSAPSTQKPYCFSTTKQTGDKIEYKKSALGENNVKVRAPSSIPEKEDEKLYIMTHLQFQVNDLETLLLDRIIEINNKHINNYLEKLKILLLIDNNFKSKINSSQLKKFITDRLNVENKEEHINFIKALLIKDYIKSSSDEIEISKLDPLVIIYHPFNKYDYYNSYQIYKMIKDNSIIKLQTNIITDEEIASVGNSPSSIWEIIKQDKKEDNKDINDIYFKKGDTKFELLNNTEYDIVFETEANAKQFGSKDDYYTIKNRETMDKNNCVKLHNTYLLTKNLNKHHIIKLDKDCFIIKEKSFGGTVNEDKKISFTICFKLGKLNGDGDDLNNYTIEGEDYYMKIEIPEFEIDKMFNNLYNFKGPLNFFNEEGFPEDKGTTTKIIQREILDNFFKEVNEKFDDHLNKNELKNIIIKDKTYKEIFKINSLIIEEVKLDFQNVGKNALVFASVWMYGANKDNNKMFEQDYKTLGKTDNIPLCSGPICTDATDKTITYKKSFNKTNELRARINSTSMVEQVYVNNDQVQYFNNEMKKRCFQKTNNNYELCIKESELHYMKYDSYAQHVFRVFGVNLNKSQEIIKNKNLQKFMEQTSTNKYYYCGIQISSELNELTRKIKDPKKDIIYKNLFLLGLIYTREDLSIDNITNIDDFKKNLYNLLDEWNKSYGQPKPTEYNKIKEQPIHSNMKNIFPITLKYKLKTIEEDNTKKIFNVGDSNTSVNFFSGTGLNTGISTCNYILKNFRFNDDKNTEKINNELKVKNRRTIYNSLLSSQNPSHLSQIRNFKVDNNIINNIGFHKNNFKKQLDYKDIEKLVEKINYDDDSNIRNKRFFYLLKNWELFYKHFLSKEEIKQDDDTNKICTALYWNLYVFYYNLYIENPVSTHIDYKKEGITYLNHLLLNYFDFCNFMTGDDTNQNSKYTCDLLKGTRTDYDPLTSENPLRKISLTT